MTDSIARLPLLTAIRSFTFDAQPGPSSASGWQGQGNGQVRIEQQANQIRFHEQGHFQPAAGGNPVAFTNVYRWEVEVDRLRLFHERRGPAHAVWLFDLVAGHDSLDLVSDEAHLCGMDNYWARLHLWSGGFDLHWQIRGPRKDETLHYRYR
ncbi:DUF6314 family protein [Litchfieldella xinjiangensis]|uniref:DUF6314 family protein n=1 Tax=Litchfieldella xinjiangensis TaxID=1166948 RepID=UPI000695093C|nr:DUF6314 family protein [Halomonas xinjiangensis]